MGGVEGRGYADLGLHCIAMKLFVVPRLPVGIGGASPGKRGYPEHGSHEVHFNFDLDLRPFRLEPDGNPVLPLMLQPPHHLSRNRVQQMGVQHLSLRIPNHETNDVPHPPRT